MAVEIKTSKFTLMPFKLNLGSKTKTFQEIALDEFHEWVAECKKYVHTNKDGEIIKTVYDFPEKTIIIKGKGTAV